MREQIMDCGYAGDFTVESLIYSLGESFSYLTRINDKNFEAVGVYGEKRLWASGYETPQEALMALAIAFAKKDDKPNENSGKMT